MFYTYNASFNVGATGAAPAISENNRLYIVQGWRNSAYIRNPDANAGCCWYSI